MSEDHPVISYEEVSQLIYRVRGKSIMLDKDLSILYGVQAKVLNQAVTRNIDRFPNDFMFRLSWEEAKALRSQNVTLKRGKHAKYAPRAFTEQGIAMLSSVLKSKKAIKVNIQIIRTFTRLRRMILSYEDLKNRIDIIEQKFDRQFRIVFEAINKMLAPEKKTGREIGFKPEP